MAVQNRLRTLVGASLVAAGLVAGSAHAEIVFDPGTGEGFVGKGDVQSVFDWNNALLQANADSLEFRFGAVGAASWKCKWYAGNKWHEQTVTTTSYGVGFDVAVEARKNNKGQVTGFYLLGKDGASTTTAAKSCPTDDGNQMKEYVEGSFVSAGEGDPALQVRLGDSGEWHDLPY